MGLSQCSEGSECLSDVLGKSQLLPGLPVTVANSSRVCFAGSADISRSLHFLPGKLEALCPVPRWQEKVGFREGKVYESGYALQSYAFMVHVPPMHAAEIKNRRTPRIRPGIPASCFILPHSRARNYNSSCGPGSSSPPAPAPAPAYNFEVMG